MGIHTTETGKKGPLSHDHSPATSSPLLQVPRLPSLKQWYYHSSKHLGSRSGAAFNSIPLSSSPDLANLLTNPEGSSFLLFLISVSSFEEYCLKVHASCIWGLPLQMPFEKIVLDFIQDPCFSFRRTPEGASAGFKFLFHGVPCNIFLFLISFHLISFPNIKWILCYHSF